MFLIEIAGVRILYTGDYSREEDRHLMAAERPPNVVPEVLICEATYGVQSHEPRPEREARFTRMVHTIVKRYLLLISLVVVDVYFLYLPLVEPKNFY
jgi:cleavage and polyadenylation specificity factor subunit 3